MSEIRFTRDHEWVRVEDGVGTVGVTKYAQEQLGDVVFVELPETGKKLAAGEEGAVVESVKAASEVFTPVSGEVAEVNEALGDKPSLVNEDAENDGWFFKLTLSDESELEGLMTAEAYAEYVSTLE